MNQRIRFVSIFILLIAMFLNGCSAKYNCPITEPVWVKPPEDAAVLDTPEFGYYFVNEDSSIMASAWWARPENEFPIVLEEGIKVGWFKPEGADLFVIGKRLDAEAPALDAHVPCCYPTRFQASGLYFPTAGCWEVNAKAADKELSFIVWLEP